MIGVTCDLMMNAITGQIGQSGAMMDTIVGGGSNRSRGSVKDED